MALPLNVISDICDVTGAWADAFLSEVSLKRYRRACAWAMSEAAKWGAEGATDAIPATFSNPTPWMMKAFTYTRALDRKGNEIEADVAVRPSQSIVMKYAMGEGQKVRRPGDVGLSKDRILVPNWRNLQLTQGIGRNAYGNLPGGSPPASPGKRQERGPSAGWQVDGACTRARWTSAGLGWSGTSLVLTAARRRSARTTGPSS